MSIYFLISLQTHLNPLNFYVLLISCHYPMMLIASQFQIRALLTLPYLILPHKLNLILQYLFLHKMHPLFGLADTPLESQKGQLGCKILFAMLLLPLHILCSNSQTLPTSHKIIKPLFPMSSLSMNLLYMHKPKTTPDGWKLCNMRLQHWKPMTHGTLLIYLMERDLWHLNGFTELSSNLMVQ